MKVQNFCCRCSEIASLTIVGVSWWNGCTPLEYFVDRVALVCPWPFCSFVVFLKQTNPWPFVGSYFHWRLFWQSPCIMRTAHQHPNLERSSLECPMLHLWYDMVWELLKWICVVPQLPFSILNYVTNELCWFLPDSPLLHPMEWCALSILLYWTSLICTSLSGLQSWLSADCRKAAWLARISWQPNPKKIVACFMLGGVAEWN